MTIHEPCFSSEEDTTTVAARIEFETPGIDLPETLWFRFPELYNQFLTDRADGFVSMLLSLAMRLGERIYVKGKLSPRLLYGLHEYQSFILNWKPPGFRRVEIQCEQLEAMRESDVSPGVLTPFSGGVDSTYTLWSHLPRNQPLVEYQVTHALYIQGVDVWLDEDETMRQIVERHSTLAEQSGFDFIPAASNFHSFSRYRPWITFHAGQYAAAVAQILGRGFRCFIATGNLCYTDLQCKSRSPATDYLFSTETLTVLHHGSGARRYEKIAALAAWEESHTTLRICRGDHGDAFNNCCRCRKCVATMVRLDALGVLSKYKTFPLPLRRSLIWRLPLFDVGGLRADREAMIRDAIRRGRRDLVFDLGVMYFLNASFFWVLRRRYRSLRSWVRKARKSMAGRRAG